MSAPAASSTILIVEDNDFERRWITRLLERVGYRCIAHECAEDALAAMTGDDCCDVVLTDMRLPKMSGLDLVEQVNQIRSGTPVILMTGQGSIGTAVKAMRLGAFDFIVKPLDPIEVVEAAIAKAVAYARLRRRNQYLETVLENAGGAEMMIGTSKPMQQVRQLITLAAASNTTVLIQGDSGTGKELAARAIHAASRRASGPFIAVNCAAISESLLESELFGHEHGSFTGAAQAKKGLFEAANGGTLFLDEASSMSTKLQAMLLRVVQEREVRAVGATTPKPIDVRLVAATNVNLQALVDDGQFRLDLMYRLDVIHIDLPPLRERAEDIPLLLQRFLHREARALDRPTVEVGPAAIAQLTAYDWPGNIRELANVAARITVMTPTHVQQIQKLAPHLFRPAAAVHPPAESIATTNVQVDIENRSFREADDLFRRLLLTRALEAHKGSVAAAARALELDSSNMRRMMKRLGI